MRRADLVIFDCDGTLIDSEGPVNRVLAEYVSELGLPLTAEESERRFRGMQMAAVAEALAADGLLLPADWLEVYHARTIAEFERELNLIPYALEAVEAMTVLGVGTCVASQSSPSYLHAALSRTGLWERFAGRVFSASMVKRGKPYPDLFLHAAEVMRAGFDRCVVVEDSITGVKAAVAAGMRCLALAGGDDVRTMAALGAEPIESLMEVPWAIAD